MHLTDAFDVSFVPPSLKYIMNSQYSHICAKFHNSIYTLTGFQKVKCKNTFSKALTVLE